MERKHFKFNGIKPFHFDIKLIDTALTPIKQPPVSHTHSKCEIYINLTGDVSFMVENNIYPISRGDVIIARPNEYHHCIYNSNNQHGHFWILFSADGNEDLFDLFFKREKGTNNLIVLSKENKEQLIRLCQSIIANENSDVFTKYFNFFEIINLIRGGETQFNGNLMGISDELKAALDIINEHYTEDITIKDIANDIHLSINTLERLFKKHLNMTPKEYIKKKRLNFASLLLRQKHSVYDTYIKSGFSDYSHFIQVFKAEYGITPLNYKNRGLTSAPSEH